MLASSVALISIESPSPFHLPLQSRWHPHGAGRGRGYAPVDHVLELVRIRRTGKGRFETDLLRKMGICQALVERLHAGLAGAGLHRRVDLVDLVLANQVADGGV